MNKIIEDLKLNEERIVKVILSDSKTDVKKIIVRPIIIKNKQVFQIEKFIGAQVFHENVSFEKVKELNFNDFKQISIEKTGETSVYSKKKSTFNVKTVTNNKQKVVESHNKEKNYLIKEGDNVPALIDLGIFTKENKVVKAMYDKFKQINKFIEIIDDAFKSFNKNEITILDFGCGKSYLTFLVYYYFVKIKNIKAKIIGYDIKKDVVEKCNQIAKNYHYEGLEFILSDVKKDKLFSGKIDMIITLHACDTATDFALDFAIKKQGSKYIFSSLLST